MELIFGGEWAFREEVSFCCDHVPQIIPYPAIFSPLRTYILVYTLLSYACMFAVTLRDMDMNGACLAISSSSIPYTYVCRYVYRLFKVHPMSQDYEYAGKSLLFWRLVVTYVINWCGFISLFF